MDWWFIVSILTLSAVFAGWTSRGKLVKRRTAYARAARELGLSRPLVNDFPPDAVIGGNLDGYRVTAREIAGERPLKLRLTVDSTTLPARPIPQDLVIAGVPQARTWSATPRRCASSAGSSGIRRSRWPRSTRQHANSSADWPRKGYAVSVAGGKLFLDRVMAGDTARADEIVAQVRAGLECARSLRKPKGGWVRKLMTAVREDPSSWMRARAIEILAAEGADRLASRPKTSPRPCGPAWRTLPPRCALPPPPRWGKRVSPSSASWRPTRPARRKSPRGPSGSSRSRTEDRTREVLERMPKMPEGPLRVAMLRATARAGGPFQEAVAVASLSSATREVPGGRGRRPRRRRHRERHPAPACRGRGCLPRLRSASKCRGGRREDPVPPAGRVCRPGVARGRRRQPRARKPRRCR